MKTITKVALAPEGPIWDLFEHARDMHHHVWFLQLTTTKHSDGPYLVTAATELDARVVAAETTYAGDGLGTAGFWLHPGYSTCEMIPCEPGK